MTTTAPRDTATRLADTRAMLAAESMCWVATATADSRPAMIPLSYSWQDDTIVVVTPGASPTAVNLRRAGARLAFGQLLDVVMIDADLVEEWPVAAVPTDVADRYIDQVGTDARGWGADYVYFRLRPRRVQAWRTEPEIPGRTLMRDGTWVDAD